MNGAARRNRFVELDALRAFAVTLVVWSHTVRTEIGIDRYKIGGYHAVSLFFVISGFLITGILLDTRDAVARRAVPPSVGLRIFYIRRFLRIFPVYYAVLLLTFILARTAVRGELRWHLMYLSNWYFAYKGAFHSPLPHLWSLAIEEQFYVVWPWFTLLLPAAALPWTIGMMILSGPLSRLILSRAGANDVAVWVTTPTVLDALGLGCLLAYLWRDTEWADRVALWAVLLAFFLVGLQQALTLVATPAYVHEALKTTPWAFFCMWLVHRASRGFTGWTGRLLRARPLLYLGKISYGVYLLHVLVTMTVEPKLGSYLPMVGHAGVPLFIAVMLITVGTASLSWKFFEQPINSLKDRFPYGQSAQRVGTVEPGRIPRKEDSKQR